MPKPSVFKLQSPNINMMKLENLFKFILGISDERVVTPCLSHVKSKK